MSGSQAQKGGDDKVDSNESGEQKEENLSADQHESLGINVPSQSESIGRTGKLGDRINSQQSNHNREDQGEKLQRLLESNKKLIEKQRGNSTKIRNHSKNQEHFMDAKQSEPHFESEPAD